MKSILFFLKWLAWRPHGWKVEGSSPVPTHHLRRFGSAVGGVYEKDGKIVESASGFPAVWLLAGETVQHFQGSQTVMMVICMCIFICELCFPVFQQPRKTIIINLKESLLKS